MTPDKIHQTLVSCSKSQSYLIAYSGGLDSHVLLHLMAKLQQQQPELIQLRAVYINHGLQDEAKLWGQHCAEICADLSIPFEAVQLKLSLTKGDSIEAVARKGRYQAFAGLLQENEVLLTAQHQNDQAETLLLQLLRGSGVDGLAAMSVCKSFGKGLLIRPLLEYSRKDLEVYASSHQLQHIEDPSNQNQRFDRNFLRQTIMPQLETRWQGITKVLSRAAKHQAESKALLDEFASIDLKQIQAEEKNQVSISDLSELSKNRQKLVLRHWIKEQGYLPLSTKKLAHLFNDVIDAKADAKPILCWGNGDERAEIRRYENKLYLMPALEAHDQRRIIPWELHDSLRIENIGVTLYPDGIKDLLPQVKGAVTVRFRQGGETIFSTKQGRHIRLKRLFQESGVPPWLRSRIPLIYQGDQLLMVFGFIV